MPDPSRINHFAEPLATHWAEVREYARRLVADLSNEDMISQPVPGVTLNHAAWVLSHLSAYGPVLAGILRNEPVEDPINHPFGRGSVPSPNAADHLPKHQLIQHFTHVYDDAVAALTEASDDTLQRENPVERWRTRFPRVCNLPIQFLIKHNCTHLGQISAWRRAAGRPPV